MAYANLTANVLTKHKACSLLMRQVSSSSLSSARCRLMLAQRQLTDEINTKSNWQQWINRIESSSPPITQSILLMQSNAGHTQTCRAAARGSFRYLGNDCYMTCGIYWDRAAGFWKEAEVDKCETGNNCFGDNMWCSAANRVAHRVCPLTVYTGSHFIHSLSMVPSTYPISSSSSSA